MPKLKLTYTQIKEQAARDIRNRTAARQAQLHRSTFVHKSKETKDFEETNSEEEDTDSEEEHTEPKGYSYKAQLFFLFLLLVFLKLSFLSCRETDSESLRHLEF